ncbi:MAG: carbonic anhydrase [Bacteroidia bacterium]|nr:carbonic anhydrase [Bacteroidia bacterium]
MKSKIIANLKYDLPSGMVTFLVALPLCLGVALASGAPLISGLVSGIIGGIVVGMISGSSTSVSGPAAGLAAIVLSSIEQLGSFELFLAAVVIAGIIQLIAGLLKAGYISDAFPSNVIKGLLAAIGILLILKQIPHAVGFDVSEKGDILFLDEDGKGTFSFLSEIFNHLHLGAVLVAGITILVLVVWDKTPMKKIRFFPASLFVVLLAVAINKLFITNFPQLALSDAHLVNIPKVDGLALFSSFKIPQLSVLVNSDFWIIAITIAIVASLETLLNIEAVDNLDPHRRHSPPNRELVAQGIGNIFSGFLGGLPITSVIVRSSVNINANAQSKTSTILHGILLMGSVFVLSPLLNLIPLSSLAAILIVTGYKLAKVSLFKQMYKKGLNQFIPFMATVIAIIFTDLLIGVIIGLSTSAFYLLKYNYLNPFLLQREKVSYGETVRIELPSQTTFLSKATMKNALWQIPEKSKVIIDASRAVFIDHDIRELLDDFKTTVAKERQIQLNIIGGNEDTNVADYLQFENVIDQKQQEYLTPKEVIELLKDGNERFVNGTLSRKFFPNQVKATSKGQHPMAIVVSCIDSRTTAERMFDTNIGDLFSVRIAGNVINKDVLGSMEFACKIAKSKVIVIIGHTKCGAVKGACDEVKMGNLTELLDKLQPAIDKTLTMTKGDKILPSQVDEVAKVNVELSVEAVLSQSEILNDLCQKGEIAIIGGMYDVHTGKVTFFH